MLNRIKIVELFKKPLSIVYRGKYIYIYICLYERAEFGGAIT